MSEDQGYSGKSLDCLKKNNAKVGDSIKITADLTYSGILMPRYESGDDKHLVLKLGNGYNVSIVVSDIQKIQILSSPEAKPKQSEERKEDLGRTITLEEGKVISEGMMEVDRCKQTIIVSAEEAKRLNSEVLPLDAAPGNSGKFGFTFFDTNDGICSHTSGCNFITDKRK